MARSTVRMDGEELTKLKKQIMLLGDSAQMDAFLRSCAKELAARLLAKVIKRTPVGVYPDRTGGTLRRGWTANSEREAELNAVFGGEATSAVKYAQSLNVQKVGSDYVIEIINPVEYASYVEFGHRTANHTGWVEGQFMLTISEREIQNAAPQILEKKIEKRLKECFK